MDWLLDNSLATMQGTHFLIFYGVTAFIVLTGAYLFVAAQDTTGAQRPPATPSVIDPYELAYLRGGTNEVVRTAVYSLRQQGLVEVETGRIRASGSKPQDLTSIERRVYEAILSTQKIATLFSRDMRQTIERLCGAYQQRLSAQQLLAPPEIRETALLALTVAGILLAALAGYKIWAALAHGHSNLGLLVGEATVAFFALLWIYRRTAQVVASKRGKAFVAQIQLAYSGRGSAVFGASAGGAGRAAAGSSALLMVGLFGFGVLRGTPDAALAKAFAQSSGSGDSGGSCGGGDGGGGCGGCGGS
jgi:uncharacterized protein (TIGR04222 family)